MKNKNFYRNIEGIMILISLMLLSPGCEKELAFDKATVVQGVINALNEFSFPLDDGDSVLITIKDTRFSTLTDSKGYFKFEGIPIGKYTIMLEKKGYVPDSVSWFIEGIRDTVDVRHNINQFSNTLITDFSVELREYNFYIKGTITHNSLITDFSNYDFNLCAVIEVFCSENSNVSREAYNNFVKGISAELVFYYAEAVFVPSGEKFYLRMIHIPWPHSGETYYYVAYGGSGLNSKSYHPSNIFSFTID